MLKQPPQVRLSLTGQVFGSLSVAHRAVLWNIEVERHSIAEVTDILGLTPKEVIIQLSTARVSFRNKWSELQRTNPRFSRGCRWTTSLTQGPSSPNRGYYRQPHVLAHLKSCLRCAILVDESDYLTQHLRDTLVPLVASSPNLDPTE